MKTFSRLFFCLILSTFAAGCSAGFGTDDTITGFVQSTETDENDNPTDIFLFDGKEEYAIKKNDVRDELLDYLDRKISATGTVSESWGGKKTIAIDEYKVLD